jgi:predicted transcriptional regulator
MTGMAMLLRLSDDQTAALRARADAEHTSMQHIALRAVAEYIERHSREDLVCELTERIKIDYADALRRLGD